MKSLLAAALVALGFTTTAPAGNQTPRQAVIVHFKYGSTDLQPLYELEDRLKQVVSKATVGELDGHGMAIDGSAGDLYFYGPDADRLFESIEPILESSSFMRGAQVNKRYGPPNDGVREVVQTLAR